MSERRRGPLSPLAAAAPIVVGAAPPVSRFRGPDAIAALRQASAVLGDDAEVLRTDVRREAPQHERVEITVVAADALQRFRRRITPLAPFVPDRRRDRAERPPVVALVGPTGAGKTTTLMKLALHSEAFAAWTIGIVTLDSYRTGALEQLHAFAEVARLPLEVVYDAGEVEGALRRLSRCDLVLADTPGRSPKSAELNARWNASLAALDAREVHLVAPASLRPDLATAVRGEFRDAGVTHALLSKLDEVPNEHGVAELAARLALPVRWVTDGQDVPADLHAGSTRVLQSLAAAPPDAAPLTFGGGLAGGVAGANALLA